VDWIRSDQIDVRLRVLVNPVMNLKSSIKYGKFLDYLNDYKLFKSGFSP
jgi:hypothetical protein